jgi:hypothetical protein
MGKGQIVFCDLFKTELSFAECLQHTISFEQDFLLKIMFWNVIGDVYEFFRFKITTRPFTNHKNFMFTITISKLNFQELILGFVRRGCTLGPVGWSPGGPKLCFHHRL